MTKKTSTARGSVLVFSIIILSIILVTSLSVVSVSVLERKSSGSTARSVQSFNVAQSGVEIVLYQFRKNPALDDPANDLNDLASELSSSCSNGVINLSAIAGGSATLSFKDAGGTIITDCNELLSSIVIIRSLGTANGTSRAVEVAAQG